MPAERLEEIENYKNKLLWQKRILGHDVFGLGVNKPSPLDHLMTTNTQRYDKNKNIKD